MDCREKHKVCLTEKDSVNSGFKKKVVPEYLYSKLLAVAELFLFCLAKLIAIVVLIQLQAFWNRRPDKTVKNRGI